MHAGRKRPHRPVPEAMVTAFEDRGDRVAVSTADGRTFTGAAVVASDGVRSLFREKLIGDGEPRPTRLCGEPHHRADWLRLPRLDVPRDQVLLWGGPGFHVVHYPLRHNTLFNIVAVFRTSTYAERGDAAVHGSA